MALESNAGMFDKHSNKPASRELKQYFKSDLELIFDADHGKSEDQISEYNDDNNNQEGVMISLDFS